MTIWTEVNWQHTEIGTSDLADAEIGLMDQSHELDTQRLLEVHLALYIQY